MRPLRENARAAGILLPLLACLLCPALHAQTSDSPKASGVRAMHVLGLEGVKQKQHGTLTVQPGGLSFTAKDAHGMLDRTSIASVFTGAESRQTGGKVLTVAKIGIPYGGGRVLSLFSHEKVDTLTVEFRDANGALHGAIFTMPLGQAAILKEQLAAGGGSEKASAGGHQ
jgi:hypothetical protein